MIHRIDRGLDLFGDPAGSCYAGELLGGGECIKFLPVCIHERRELRRAESPWGNGLFLWQ
jgi:hypothetical protein